QQECCGFGGLFSVKNADISSAMLTRKMDAIEASGADRVVSCDLGCLLHIGGGLHRRGSNVRAQHIAEFLDEAARWRRPPSSSAPKARSPTPSFSWRCRVARARWARFAHPPSDGSKSPPRVGTPRSRRA